MTSGQVGFAAVPGNVSDGAVLDAFNLSQLRVLAITLFKVDKIMHGMLEADHGIVLMGADTPNSMEHNPGTGFQVSLSGDDEATLRGYWDGLSGSGTSGPATSTRGTPMPLVEPWPKPKPPPGNPMPPSIAASTIAAQ